MHEDQYHAEQPQYAQVYRHHETLNDTIIQLDHYEYQSQPNQAEHRLANSILLVAVGGAENHSDAYRESGERAEQQWEVQILYVARAQGMPLLGILNVRESHNIIT